MELSPSCLVFERPSGALDSIGFLKFYRSWSKQLRLESGDDPTNPSSLRPHPSAASGYRPAREPISTEPDAEGSPRSLPPIFPSPLSEPWQIHNRANPRSTWTHRSEKS